MHVILAVLTLHSVLKCVDSYLYPYDSEIRETKSLDGLWDFKICPENDIDKGFREDWPSRDFSQLGDSIKMPVPASYNDVTTNKTLRDYVGWAWYQRQFYIPNRWLQGSTRVFIHFGGVHYLAAVFLNGNKVGEHEGGHLPFQIELPQTALNVLNMLTVAVNNTLSLQTIPQGELTYPNDTSRYPKGYRLYKHDFEYFDYAGINRPVILFTTPHVHITGIQVSTDVQFSKGTVRYLVSTSAAAQCRCQVSLLDRALQPVSQSAGCHGVLVVQDPQLWWPVGTCHHTPGYLYTFKVTLSSPDSESDEYSLPVGIRTVNTTNSSLLINNEPVYLRGFGMHEDADIRGRGFDYAVMSRDLSLISWVGANAIRTSHYPYAEETLNQADALGILVILEAPACTIKEFSDGLYQRHVAYLREMVAVHRNRPSVVMWSLANEPQTSSESSGYYFGNLSLVARELDSTRLITFVTSQDVKNDKAVHHMDVVCVNRYRAWYTDSGLTDLIPSQVSNELTAWHARYNRPVILTEYGAGSVSGLHTLPESMWTEDYQDVTYHQHFKAFDQLRQKGILSGEMIWNFIDFNTQQEYTRPGRCSKGLFTRERQPKHAAHTVRSRYHTLDDCADRE